MRGRENGIGRQTEARRRAKVLIKNYQLIGRTKLKERTEDAEVDRERRAEEEGEESGGGRRDC